MASGGQHPSLYWMCQWEALVTVLQAVKSTMLNVSATNNNSVTNKMCIQPRDLFPDWLERLQHPGPHLVNPELFIKG